MRIGLLRVAAALAVVGSALLGARIDGLIWP